MLQILLPSGQRNQFASIEVHEDQGKKLLIELVHNENLFSSFSLVFLWFRWNRLFPT